MSEETDLLVCPFCNGRASIDLKQESAAGFGVLCLTCGSTAVNLIRWNTRHTNNALNGGEAIRSKGSVGNLNLGDNNNG